MFRFINACRSNLITDQIVSREILITVPSDYYSVSTDLISGSLTPTAGARRPTSGEKKSPDGPNLPL
jgi:hypothetical protein